VRTSIPTIILPVILYGCENKSLTSSEEHRLNVYTNRLLRGTFGHEKDEGKLHDEELYNLYTLSDIIRIKVKAVPVNRP
jgi:hypothetical protein